LNGSREQTVEPRLAQFAVGQTFNTLPAAVIERTKEVFLDTVGIMIAAAAAPTISNLRNTLVTRDLGVSTVFGSKFKGDPSIAALLNGSLSTVTQFDEGHRASMGHPGIHIVPAALAMGEAKRISGKDLLVAIATGYEIAVRIGLAVFPLQPMIHPHGNWATIGAAFSVGKILSLTENQFVNILNCISTLTLFAWRKATTSGATIHHLTPGLGASHAIVVALAVQAGYIGPPLCLEQYFLPLSSAHPKPEMLTEGLGSTYEILNNYFKAYPACAHAHSTIEAMEKLLANLSISEEHIDWVEVRTYPVAAHLSEQNPPNALAGLFSIPYCLGTILVKGKLDVAPLVAEDPVDPQILTVASRIRVVKHEHLKPPYPEGRPSVVRVRLKNGAEHEECVALPRGDQMRRLTKKELESKFLRIAEPVIGKKRADELRRKIDDLENVPDVGQLLMHLWQN